MSPPLPLTVGVTGHRNLGDHPTTPWYVFAQCTRILDRLQELARFRDAGVVAYSALAIGADTLFAQAALALNLPLVGLVPFADYADVFDGPDRPQFETLLKLCQEVQRLPGKERSDQAYLEAGKRLVDQVDFLIAVWDGKPAGGVGGTGDVVAYARQRQKVVFRIDPADAPGK